MTAARSRVGARRVLVGQVRSTAAIAVLLVGAGVGGCGGDATEDEDKARAEAAVRRWMDAGLLPVLRCYYPGGITCDILGSTELTPGTWRVVVAVEGARNRCVVVRLDELPEPEPVACPRPRG